jgi:hypothetical protein
MAYSLRKFCFLIAIFCAQTVFGGPQHGCGFMGSAPEVAIPANLKSVSVDRYLRISYPFGDPLFADVDPDGMPRILQKQLPVFQKSRHFLETELGWRLPWTRREAGRIELDVYFFQAGRRFWGTVRTDRGPAIVMNRRALTSPDFAALWIHQLAHAAELQYRDSGEYWFFEATAGWMEGQFQGYSETTRKAQEARLAHPEINYFLLSTGERTIDAESTDVRLAPFSQLFSAAVAVRTPAARG